MYISLIYYTNNFFLHNNLFITNTEKLYIAFIVHLAIFSN